MVTKKELLEAKRVCKSDSEIGKIVNLSSQRVYQLRKIWKIPSSRKEIPARNDKIVSLFKKGMNGIKIAQEIGISIAQTYKILVKSGVVKEKSKNKIVQNKTINQIIPINPEYSPTSESIPVEVAT